MKKLLLLGAGSSRKLKLSVSGHDGPFEITTVDVEPNHHPDVLFDLNFPHWPFEDNSFDRIDAYEILEHLGRQGDVASFFSTFYQIWRILKPGGVLVATCPWWQSIWALGDPGHTRVISPASLPFLDQQEYVNQVGKTAMSDYRSLWAGDFVTAHAARDGEDGFQFVLIARKNAV